MSLICFCVGENDMKFVLEKNSYMKFGTLPEAVCLMSFCAIVRSSAQKSCPGVGLLSYKS